MTSELKPCDHCGGNAEFNHLTREVVVQCKCGIRTKAMSREMAIAVWNRRNISFNPVDLTAIDYARRMAVSLWEKHYKEDAPNWEPLDGIVPILTQIDNMTSGLTRKREAS